MSDRTSNHTWPPIEISDSERRTLIVATSMAGGVLAVGIEWPGRCSGFCHDSTIDDAGRVIMNKPEPSNLEVPPFRFASDTRILIGNDAEA